MNFANSADDADAGAANLVELGLGPATRMYWRSPESVHLELGSEAVVVDGLPSALIRRVAAPVAPAGEPPPIGRAARQALAALAESGYLWPRAATADDPRLMPPEPRLAGELASLATQHGEHAAAVLRSRHGATVEVHGRGRVAAHLGAVLAAAGIGRVHVAGDGVARLFHVMPGGVTTSDEGQVLAAAAEQALRRVAPSVDTTPLPIGQRPELTVLAVDGAIPDDRLDALHAAGAPYLAVRLGVDHGIVGPLVLPGLTSCLRCADLHRRDRDPAWPALAVQLTIGRRHGPASAVSVATVITGVAAQQALAFLDGGEPGCLDGTIELRLPDWRLRRRSWPPHGECGCVSTATSH